MFVTCYFPGQTIVAPSLYYSKLTIELLLVSVTAEDFVAQLESAPVDDLDRRDETEAQEEAEQPAHLSDITGTFEIKIM